MLAINKPDSVVSVDEGSLAPSSGKEIILAQKLYKIIVSIDYSSQISNIDFIEKSLQKIFEKISNEYNEFYNNCMNIEPSIYVTVILWNSSFFECPTNGSNTKGTDTSQSEFVPFIILCHAKRLLNSNLKEIALYIFDKFNEGKQSFLNLIEERNVRTADSDHLLNNNENNLGRYSTNGYKSEFGSFEQLLDHLIKIFSYFRFERIQFQD